MKVRMNGSVAVAGAAYSRGQEVEIADNVATSWAASGLVTVLDATEAEVPEVPVQTVEELAAEAEPESPAEDDVPEEQPVESAETEGDVAAEVETEPEERDEATAEAEEEAAAEPQSEITVGYAYDEMSLAELKAAAKEQDLATSGTKADLIERLRGE